jgi:hypothetical protein
MFILQRACEIQLMAQATGEPLIFVSANIVAGMQSQASEVTKAAGGKLAWPGILRKLDRMCPNYKN